jgi:predicted DNA-binding transcriptional regulator AlpA
MATDQKLPTPPLDERDAARCSGYTPAAFRAWRSQGRGPAYIRIGRSVRYRVEDLDAWLTAHRVETRESR